MSYLLHILKNITHTLQLYILVLKMGIWWIVQLNLEIGII